MLIGWAIKPEPLLLRYRSFRESKKKKKQINKRPDKYVHRLIATVCCVYTWYTVIHIHTYIHTIIIII